MSIGIFLGIEFGRIFFCLSGAIIDNVGWEFLFYFPGAFSVLVATLYYIFMTDDPLENTWISSAEKTLLAESHKLYLQALHFTSTKIIFTNFYNNMHQNQN